MTTDRTLSARMIAALGAGLAVIPVTVYLVWFAAPSVVLALVNVLLIAGSLYLLFGPADVAHDHTAHAAE